jgi:hypothetical protein
VKAALLLMPLAVACGATPAAEHMLCLEHRCDTVPLAFEATDLLVEEVVSELEAATGIGVITDPFGTPVFFEPVVSDPESGAVRCGITITVQRSDGDILYQEIRVSTDLPDCGSQRRTIAHEIIHALVPRAEHARNGLFAEKANHIEHYDHAALTVLCTAWGGCPRYAVPVSR